jgi:hypothetical protein
VERCEEEEHSWLYIEGVRNRKNRAYRNYMSVLLALKEALGEIEQLTKEVG